MRDGRRQRLGIGSLVTDSDLFSKAVDEGTLNPNATTGNQAYLDRILSEAGPDTLSLDPGAYVNTRDNRYINDAYNYYLGGGLDDVTEGVDLETGQQDFTGGELIDIGGEGQATSGLDTTPITTDITSDQIDEFNLPEPTTGGVTNDNITVENIAQNQTPYDVPMDMSDPGASIENIIAQQNQTIPDDPSIDAFDINEVGDPSQNMLDVPTQDVGLAYTGEFDPNDEGTVFSNELENFEPEQQGIIDQAFSKVGSTAENIMNDLSQIPGAVADFANQTVDIFGKKINVGKTLLSAGINKLVGGPISLVFDALGGLPQDSLANSTTRNIAAQLTAENDYDGYNMQSGNIGQDPFGRNPVSALGDYEQTLAEDAVSTSTTKMGLAKKQYAEDYFNAKAEVAGGVDMEDGTVVGPGEMPITQGDGGSGYDGPPSAPADDYDFSDFDEGDTSVAADIPTGSNPIDSFFDTVDQGSDSSTVDSSGNVTDSSGQSQGNINDEFSQPESTYDAQEEDDQYEDQSYSGGGGGGSSNGGGKSIVCTAMYQTTGLEDWSKAMKIWYIYQKKYLTIQHQEGYHKLFKPFVKGMHKNKIIRAIGAHVAKHRTQDLKHIMFGSKSSWLGRVYRKILEPICYLVGKYAK